VNKNRKKNSFCEVIQYTIFKDKNILSNLMLDLEHYDFVLEIVVEFGPLIFMNPS